MLINLFNKTVISTAIALIGFSIETSYVQAATVTYDFDVKLTSGLLNNNLYKGFFSYDDSNLTKVGQEKIEIEDNLSLSFDFLDVSYTEVSDVNYNFGFPFVEFNNGNLVGLAYIVNDIPNNSIFAIFGDDPDGLGGGSRFQYIDADSFELGEGEVSEGSVSYRLRPIPEPSTAVGLGVVGCIWLLRKKITK